MHGRKHYSPGFAELTFDGKTTGFKNLIVAFDSGASYTYLNSQVYQGLISLVSGKTSHKISQTWSNIKN